MSIVREKVISDLSKLEICGGDNGLIEGFNVFVNQMPAQIWNGFADRLVSKTHPDMMEPTEHSEFYSRRRLTVGVTELQHGGNGFMRIAKGEIHNRLWCHNETARSFWWAVKT